MASKLKVMGIHGLGDHRRDPWAEEWEKTIRQSLARGADLELTFVPFRYDEIFDRIKITPLEAMSALAKLTVSGFLSPFRRGLTDGPAQRGLIDSAQQWLKWYAGYIVAWVENEQFRATVRKELFKTLEVEKPDLVLAHSLGSLISYDAFTSDDDLAAFPEARGHLPRLTYVTLGSQIGNPFVVGNLTPGRIEMPNVARWFHLYNAEDAVFTAEIRLPGEARFLQLLTTFDIEGFADHSAVHYLGHQVTVKCLWEPLALENSRDPAARAFAKARLRTQIPASAVRSKEKRSERRALLVGINDYPNEKDRLSGCVNDVFRVSAALQECGFNAEEIRVVLNDRATAKGILERLHWLLAEAAPGDQLFFYYSGHGAQLPSYGAGDVVDRMDETLVPYDFSWTPETCITDDKIYDLYSQLPYETKLVMVFDCCHSGGIHKDGGIKVRGLTPPDDIRHRALRWDASTGMWLERDLGELTRDFGKDKKARSDFSGDQGCVVRLGRAVRLRTQVVRKYAAIKRRRLAKRKPYGPYLPVILEACKENEYAYEYRHGVESYGAFTYALTECLRRRQRIRFKDLVAEASAIIKHKLRYEQEPAILGPKSILASYVPWAGDSRDKRSRRERKRSQTASRGK